MATIEEAAAGLAQALKSGNAQESEAALALYADALGDDEAPAVELGPIKRSLAPEAEESEAEAEAEESPLDGGDYDGQQPEEVSEVEAPIVPAEFVEGEDVAPADDAGEDVQA